jgi:hypothetical protein
VSDIAFFAVLAGSGLIMVVSWLWVIASGVRRSGWGSLNLLLPWIWLRHAFEEPTAKRPGLVFFASMMVFTLVVPLLPDR